MGSVRSACRTLAVTLAGDGPFRRFAVATDPPPIAPPNVPVHDAVPEAADDGKQCVAAEALRFRAALREAFGAEWEGLCADLAARVLARELRLAPVELASIAALLLEHRLAEAPLALRAAPQDCPALEALAGEHGIAVRADEGMALGDVALDLRAGAIESTLPLRLATVVAACGARTA